MNSIEDLHRALLLLLKDLNAICSENNIKYSLFAGTLIGAIRHKGFIPWDDDADVVLEREEYDKLIRVLPADFNLLVSRWVTRFAHKDNPKIYIDIFVFDKTSKYNFLRKLQVIGLKAIQGTLKSRVTKNRGFMGSLVSYVFHMIGLLFSKKFKLKMYYKLATFYKNRESEYIFSSLDQFKYIGKFLPNTIMASYSTVDFEDTKLMVMDDYDYYLRAFYGDYMKLPAIEDQKPVHGNFKSN